MTRLVQLTNGAERRVALVDEPALRAARGRSTRSTRSRRRRSRPSAPLSDARAAACDGSGARLRRGLRGRVAVAAVAADRSSGRAGPLHRLRHRPDAHRQRARPPQDARRPRRATTPTDSMRMFDERAWHGGRPAPGADRRRARVVLQGHRDHAARARRGRSSCRRMPRTAAKRRRSPASTSSIRTGVRAASGWPRATSSRTTASSGRTI